MSKHLQGYLLSHHLIWKTIIFRSKWSRFKSLALHHDNLWMYLEEYLIFINNVYSDLYMPCTVLPQSHAKICGCFGAFLSAPLQQNVMWGPNTTTPPWSFPKASIVSHTMTFFGVLLGCWPKPQEKPPLERAWDIIECVPAPIDKLREKHFIIGLLLGEY